MRLKNFISLFLIIVCCISLFAGEKYNLSQFADDTVTLIKQPKGWDRTDYYKIGAVAAGTILAMQFDQSFRDSALRDRKYDNCAIIEGGRMWGEWYSSALFVGAFALHGWIKDSNSSKKIGFELIQAAIYASAVTQVLKISIGRARPFMNEGTSSYKPFNLSDDYCSLPSGHVTNAFAVSTVLSKNVGSKILKALIYVPAVCTAVSRVYQDEHWASDCVLGAAIGYFCGAWAVDHHEQNKSPLKISSIYPLVVSIEF